MADEKDQGLEFEESDSIMPDPETLTVAVHKAEPLRGPGADASAHSEPTNEPGQEPGEDEPAPAKEPPKGKGKKDADADDDDWDPSRQAADEAEAKTGMSKADLKRRLEEVETQLAELNGAKAEAKGKASGAVADAKPEAPKWEDLPEVDDYDGKPLPQNKALNAAMKAVLVQNAALRDQVEEITGTVAEREELDVQRDNKDAYHALLRRHPLEDRNEIDKRTKADWKKRGYTPDFYPKADQMGDLVGSHALNIENERLKRDLENARKRGGRGPAGDTGQGGRRPNPRRPATVIEPDFEKAYRAQVRAGEFNDVAD